MVGTPPDAFASVRFAHPTFHNFKQPSFCILAAQCVRALPVLAALRGVERREAPGVCATHPLEAGIPYPPRSARRPPAANDVGRCASRPSTVVTSLSALPGPPSGPPSLWPF